MFDHRGDTIQWWAKFFFVLCAILCLLVGALLIISNISTLTTMSTILIFSCTILSFVFFSLLSLLLYAVGQIVENSEENNDDMEE